MEEEYRIEWLADHQNEREKAKAKERDWINLKVGMWSWKPSAVNDGEYIVSVLMSAHGKIAR